MSDKPSDKGNGRFKRNSAQQDKGEPANKGGNLRGYQERRNHGSWKSRQEYYTNQRSDRTGAIPSLPILRPPSSDNQVECERNLINFKQAIETYVRREYGEIADIFTLMEYPEFPEIEYDPEDLSKRRDPFGLKKKEIEKLMSLRLEKMDKLETDKPKVYALIKGQLSQESLDKVKQMSNWDVFDSMCDPLELGKRIIATHLVRAGVDEEKTKLEAREAFNRCRQQYNESIVQFKQRYDNRIQALRTLAEHVLDEPALAIDFIYKLDMRRYHELRKDYENNLYERVTTLDGAYELASSYVVERRNERGLFQVFVADAKGGRGGRGRNNTRYGDGRSGRGGGHGSNAKGSRRWGPSAERPCAICSSPTHWASDCPEKEDKDKTGESSERKEVSKREKVRFMNALAIVPDDVLSKGDMYDVLSNESTDVMNVPVIAEYTSGACTKESRTVSPNVLAAVSTLNANDVVLDTGAGVSVFKNSKHVFDMYDDDDMIEIYGLADDNKPLHTSVRGKCVFGDVYVSDRSMANIISYATLKDKAWAVWQEPDDDIFRVQMTQDGKVYLFRRKCGVYVHNLSRGEYALINTVSDNLKLYTKREIEGADAAMEMFKRLGYPSQNSLVRMIRGGVLTNCGVTEKDVERAILIYGKPIGAIKGKHTNTKLSTIAPVSVPVLAKHDQVMSIDIMHVREMPFIVTLITPLNLLMTVRIENRSVPHIWKKIQSQIANISKKGFKITKARVDPESGLIALDNLFASVGIEMCSVGVNQHIAEVERRIRVIKERCRAIVNTLPYRLCKKLLEYLIYFVTKRLNMEPTSVNNYGPSAWETYAGVKIDYGRMIKAAFGEYCQADTNTGDNSMDARAREVITLYESGDYDYYWWAFHLYSRKVVKRYKLTLLPMPDVVINYLNELHARDYDLENQDPRQEPLEFKIRDRILRDNALEEPMDPEQQYEMNINRIMNDYTRVRREAVNYDPHNYSDDNGDIDVRGEDYVLENVDQQVNDLNLNREVEQVQLPEEVSEGQMHDEEVDKQADYEENDNVDALEQTEPTMDIEQPDNNVEDEDDSVDDELETNNQQSLSAVDTVQDIQEVHEEQSVNRERYNLRPNRAQAGRWSGRSYGLHLTIKQGVDKLGAAATKAIIKELSQMLDRNVFHPVSLKDLTIEQKKGIISCSMFLKEKYRADGSFEKVKARLVAGGHQQDRTVYGDKVSSPTVAISSVFMIAVIAAAERRVVTTVDIPGAYLHANMPEDCEVLMRLNKYLSNVIVQLDDRYSIYMNDDGSIIVKLDKALYGCVQSSKLWYDQLCEALSTMGYVRNDDDKCVFNRLMEGNQATICVHVDDLMITCADEGTMKCITNDLRKYFGELSVNEGRVQNYIGMVFDFSEDKKVTIEMKSYINELLEYTKTVGEASTPAEQRLFDTSYNCTELSESQRAKYHTVVAKLLYLAKRARPDILLAVSYLTTRVTKATEGDLEKLDRCLRYLRRTKELVLSMTTNNYTSLIAAIDASYGVHEDRKSHSGVLLTLGGAFICAFSRKQRINTKSSCEAELVSVSDGTNSILGCRNFMINQGYKMGPAILLQDNQSTIKMLKSGKSNSERSRHIDIRFYFICDRVKRGELCVEYQETEEMVADLLTKPVQGRQFVYLRDRLLGVNL